MIKRDARSKPDLDAKDEAAHREEEKTHDAGAAPYATEQHLQDEQAKRHGDDEQVRKNDAAGSKRG